MTGNDNQEVDASLQIRNNEARARPQQWFSGRSTVWKDVEVLLVIGYIKFEYQELTFYLLAYSPATKIFPESFLEGKHV